MVPLLILLAACGSHIDMVRLDPTPRTPRPVSEVRVFAEDPPQPFTSIALIEARVGDWPNLTKATRRLTAEAARLGGEAIILQGRGGKNGLLARVIVFSP